MIDGEPLPPNPVPDGAACRCGARASRDREGFCSHGHPLLGHGADLSTRHGLHVLNSSPEFRVFEDAGRQLAAQSMTDAGGRDELSARELADHEYRSVLHVRILKLSHALAVHGEFDRRGRLRKGWIELLDRLISSAVAIDKTLGLKRRARPVPTLAEYLAARTEPVDVSGGATGDAEAQP